MALAVVAALVLPTLAMLRLTRVAAGHRRVSLQAVAALGVVWVLCWAFGAQLVSGAHIASTSAADLAVHEVRAVQAGLHDRARFAAEIRRDRYRATPGGRLLTGLRGKDVLLVFVESYGKVAVQGSSFSPQVDAVLDAGTKQLQAAGFFARSGWLTSPTFGGISWLAHSTMQSGIWVDSPSRYDQLVASNRLTLSQAFERAGWRAIDDVPSDDRYWPQGSSFYHYDKVYNRLNVGYHGPTYAYASMPDQYVYLALQRLELAKAHRPPLFAEVDLVSSHEPWTQVPPLIKWSDVGDGSIFNKLPVDRAGQSDGPEQGYGHSIEYTLRTLFSFVQHYGRKNLVMVVLGDHQPATAVTGFGASHDVPISIIAHDPAVLRRIRGWGWVDGMRPSPPAPVWPMSAFRDRFLGAFGSTAGEPGLIVTVPLPSAASQPRARGARAAARRHPGARGCRPSAAAAGRPGRRPRPGRAVRGGEPRLPAGVPRLPGGPGAVLGRLVHLRAVRGGRVHRALRLLAGPVAGPPRLAAGRGVPVRPRRARRILPPYWAALVFSLAVAWLLVRPPGQGRPTPARSSSTACWCRTSSRARAPTGRSGRSRSRPSCTSCSRCCC